MFKFPHGDKIFPDTCSLPLVPLLRRAGKLQN